MNDRPCRKGRFSESDLKAIHDAIHHCGLGPDAISAEFDWHFVKINDAVEILPILVDCQTSFDAPSWQVRRLNDPSAMPCSCGVMERGSEIGSYANLAEAVAMAIAEIVRLRVLASATDGPKPDGDHAPTTAWIPNPYRNDFIRHSLHR